MKICSICKEVKEEKDYNKNKSRKDGLNTVCKECSKERSRQYYRENGRKHLEEVTKRNKKHRIDLRDFLFGYLNQSSCKDCGNADVRVLEFDHLPEFEKDKDISLMLKRGYSIKRLMKEIKKCEVVCANCHKIRTYTRTPSYRTPSKH